jgi:hypothetical protein
MLSLPGYGIIGVAWPSGKSVYLTLIESEEGPIEVAQVEEARLVRRLPSERLVGCTSPWLLGLSVLPDGSVGIVGDCAPGSARVALRLAGTTVSELADLPAGTMVEWDPDMKHGWIENSYLGMWIETCSRTGAVTARVALDSRRCHLPGNCTSLPPEKRRG